MTTDELATSIITIQAKDSQDNNLTVGGGGFGIFGLLLLIGHRWRTKPPATADV